jgi:hypothetical protein
MRRLDKMEIEKKEAQDVKAAEARLWQPAQENTVLSPKPIHFGH